MNYSTLFPELLKQLPRFERKDLSYHYQHKNNDNLKMYIPCGRKIILWFLKYNQQNYCIYFEYDKERVEKCFFQYMSFKHELTCGCGTMIVGIKVEREICLYKYLYFMGKKYEKSHIEEHMYDFKYMVENYIQKMRVPHFMRLCVPYMSFQKDIISEAVQLPYPVFSIMGKTNHQTLLHEYCAYFQIFVEDHKKGIYKLYVRNRQNDIIFYDTALVNDLKTTHMCRKMFSKSKKYKSYDKIEYSDDESDEPISSPLIMQCVYVPSFKKWKPYKSCRRNMDSISKIKFIENKKYTHHI